MSTVGAMLVGIATTADGPARFRGRVVTLDRFSGQVALETREPALGQGASIWLHFEPPGGGRPLSVAGIVSGVARGGLITVLLSLTPGEYNRLQGLPDPQVPRRRRALPSSLTPPDIKPIQQRQVSEHRSKPESPPPGQPVEAPAGIEPDIAGLSPIERAKALAAALAELVGPSVEPAPPKPSEPMAAPVEIVAPPPEPVSPTPVAPVEVPTAAEPSAQPAWLRPVESAEVPAEVVGAPPEPVSVSQAAPAGRVEPQPEPVSPSPMAPAEAPAAAAEPSVEAAWLGPIERAEVPLEVVGSPPEPVSPTPVAPVEAPAAAAEPSVEAAWLGPIERAEVPLEVVGSPLEPVSPSPVAPVEAPPPAVKPSAVRMSLIARAKALVAVLGMRAPSAAPAPLKPSEAAEAPMEIVEPRPEPARSGPVEPAAVEPSAESVWLQPFEAVEAPMEVVAPPPEPAGVSLPEAVEAPVEIVEPWPEPASPSPVEQAGVLAAGGDFEGAWKVYYDALRVTPEDLSLWYGLGLTLSRLNRLKEAEEIFQYVVSSGDPGSEEVKHARQWLARARPLPEPAAPAVPAAPPPEPAPSPVPAASGAAREPWGTVHGKVTWREPEPPREVFLVVQGLDRDGPRLHTRLPFGELYEFDRLPPGGYHLIGGVENEWLWDLRFTVEAGQEVALDLSKQNSTNPRARV